MEHIAGHHGRYPILRASYLNCKYIAQQDLCALQIGKESDWLSCCHDYYNIIVALLLHRLEQYVIPASSSWNSGFVGHSDTLATTVANNLQSGAI